MSSTRPNGKGDRPRKVNGVKYRSNYDSIVWDKTIRGVPLEEFKKDILKCWTPDSELYEMENPEKDLS
jgi:hypothetical protein